MGCSAVGKVAALCGTAACGDVAAACGAVRSGWGLRVGADRARAAGVRSHQASRLAGGPDGAGGIGTEGWGRAWPAGAP